MRPGLSNPLPHYGMAEDKIEDTSIDSVKLYEISGGTNE